MSVADEKQAVSKIILSGAADDEKIGPGITALITQVQTGTFDQTREYSPTFGMESRILTHNGKPLLKVLDISTDTYMSRGYLKDVSLIGFCIKSTDPDWEQKYNRWILPLLKSDEFQKIPKVFIVTQSDLLTESDEDNIKKIIEYAKKTGTPVFITSAKDNTYETTDSNRSKKKLSTAFVVELYETMISQQQKIAQKQLAEQQKDAQVQLALQQKIARDQYTQIANQPGGFLGLFSQPKKDRSATSEERSKDTTDKKKGKSNN